MFDFLKKKDPGGQHPESAASASLSSSIQADAGFEAMFERIVAEALATEKGYALMSFAPLKSYQPYPNMDMAARKSFLFFAINRVTQGKVMGPDPWKAGMRLIGFLLLDDLDLDDNDLITISEGLKRVNKAGMFAEVIPNNTFISILEREIKKKGVTTGLRSALLNLSLRGSRSFLSPAETKRENYITFLLSNQGETAYDKYDRWGEVLEKFFSTLSEEEKKFWEKLFGHSRQGGSKSDPSAKWLKEAGAMVASIGEERYAETLTAWLALVKEIIRESHQTREKTDFLRDENHNILRGLIWAAGTINHKALNMQLDDYAAWAYKKKPVFGSISIKTGSACMFAFSQLPLKDGVSRLSKFKSRIKNNSILKTIDRYIANTAKAHGVTEHELQELSMPDFEIVNGKLSLAFGNITGIYDVDTATLSWEKDGKKQKSVPAEVKDHYIAGLKDLKNTIKEIESLLPAVKDRVEKSYLHQREWQFRRWCELYRDHPFTAGIARRLIWHFYEGDQKAQGFFMDGKIVDVNEKEISWLRDDTRVQLWHPVGFTTAEVLAWRSFIRKHKVVQPFKQAFREVYILTDAEVNTELYSNRYAAHILRQHQFAALCKQRGWMYHLMGAWDSHNTPTLRLPSWGITAQYYIDSDHHMETNDAGIFNHVATDQVRFVRDNNEPIPLYDVPALAFTEVMRDVDLFVGVTSIGNDPNWNDSGTPFMNTYWQSYAFGDLTESAKMREQVLRDLIPSMKIAPLCSFDKKFLVVKGKFRTYKIHMGSGNILMEPNDQYLCIVPLRGGGPTEKVYLPFEEDHLLSVILSKAVLLAEDDKIKDPTILSQINRR
ncbi:DUF4132 domain-containing protein [Fulvivirgaceae bacterium PWU4]|uniref:DUF4132 domain-containing protein n=1 Tax=Chryseosolibacter histidini TaxID=2782349 RepID=A0AAP2GNX8_9BACT|nr:DUF4132 domain-containing protein [Chryseosolibacter histidini]MBT1697315.1 DUF4132 domain-containing protein [Chryseosolibacter histidini]